MNFLTITVHNEKQDNSYYMIDIKRTHIYLFIVAGTNGEGNGTPFQYSCLENPMDEGAW